MPAVLPLTPTLVTPFSMHAVLVWTVNAGIDENVRTNSIFTGSVKKGFICFRFTTLDAAVEVHAVVARDPAKTFPDALGGFPRY